MASRIFVNLPVADLPRSVQFFEELGYAFDPRFTDENATCMIVGENIYAMLLLEKFFATLTDKPIADARLATEALVALQLESREAVDEMVRTARAAGAREFRPAQDHGFMYERSFEDLDGHVWEYFWMDAQAAAG